MIYIRARPLKRFCPIWPNPSTKTFLKPRFLIRINKMKLTKIAVWTTALMVALLYTILNGILLAVVSLLVFFFGNSAVLAAQNLPAQMSAVQWLIYLCSAFVMAFLITALIVCLYNLFAKKLAIKFELKK
jgi:hypothetical protein